MNRYFMMFSDFQRTQQACCRVRWTPPDAVQEIFFAWFLQIWLDCSIDVLASFHWPFQYESPLFKFQKLRILNTIPVIYITRYFQIDWNFLCLIRLRSILNPFPQTSQMKFCKFSQFKICSCLAFQAWSNKGLR